MLRITQIDVQLDTVEGVLIIEDDSTPDVELLKIPLNRAETLSFIDICRENNLLGNKTLISNQEVVNYTIL